MGSRCHVRTRLAQTTTRPPNTETHSQFKIRKRFGRGSAWERPDIGDFPEEGDKGMSFGILI